MTVRKIAGVPFPAASYAGSSSKLTYRPDEKNSDIVGNGSPNASGPDTPPAVRLRSSPRRAAFLPAGRTHRQSDPRSPGTIHPDHAGREEKTTISRWTPARITSTAFWTNAATVDRGRSVFVRRRNNFDDRNDIVNTLFRLRRVVPRQKVVVERFRQVRNPAIVNRRETCPPSHGSSRASAWRPPHLSLHGAAVGEGVAWGDIEGIKPDVG